MATPNTKAGKNEGKKKRKVNKYLLLALFWTAISLYTFKKGIRAISMVAVAMLCISTIAWANTRRK